MSYQQQFHSRLLQQLNDTNCRNLELQSMLAQKDDQLSTLNTRLSNALVSGAGAAGSDGDGSISHLQRRNADTSMQLDQARQALATADGKLKTATSRFHKIEADLRKQVAELQRELRHCHQQLKNPNGSSQQPRKSAQWPASTGVAPRAELDAATTEVKRLRSAYASLQKQFELEKRESGSHRGFPPADPEKSRHIEDQDDEEMVPNLKQEPRDMSSAPEASGSAPPGRRQQSLDPRPRRDSGNFLMSIATKPKPPQPRKRSQSSKDEGRPSPAKKARSELAEQVDSDSDSEASEDELNNDEEFSLDAAPAAPSTTQKLSIIPHSDMIKDLQQRFEFQAVTQHYDSGDIDAFHSKEDLSDECEELWARIKKQVDQWEEAKGEEWTFEFEKPGYRMVNPPCVTTRLMGHSGGKTQWRAGCEGKFACKKCVEEERPCFTWNGEEFWLLPLHEEDRKWKVEDGNEIRYWLNVE